MTSTEKAIEGLPAHLRRFVVAQDYAAYTPRDQAVWRHILRRLARQLRDTAHESYLRGLEATGIGLDRIPSLDEMNEPLARLGWRAVAVRGFVPPAVFTELQSLKVLAIAADIRSPEHLEYTPAPDIVHESAGHAPILADPQYAEYVRRCGVVGFKAIAALEDQAVYEAIRNLSVVKEDPASSLEDIRLAEERLQAACASRRFVSESTRASRLYWWTAEYGLVGSLESPRIYGAGLLSSLGEARHCLTEGVRKLPLGLACVDTEYDITAMQPQLFVARDFGHLFEVLEAFEATLAWKRGGDVGLEEALRARSVVHCRLSDGLELSGRVAERIVGRIPGRAPAPGLDTALARLEGPILRSRNGVALGRPWTGNALIAFGPGELPGRGAFALELPSGLRLEGFHIGDGEVIRFHASLEGRPLELPAWILLHLSEGLPSVAGGPADPGAWDRWFGELDAFAAGEAEQRARAHKAESLDPELARLYRDVLEARPTEFDGLRARVAARPDEWLLAETLKDLESALERP